MRIFLDESGFTGQDLLSPKQPIFVLASTVMSDDECSHIYRDVFSGVRAQELKHTALVRQRRGRERIIEFAKTIHPLADKFTTIVNHKEFLLLTKLVDLWLEPAMYEMGYNLYERGQNIGFSNMCYICLQGFESREFLREHLQRFQEMTRFPSPETYRGFWNRMEADHQRCRPEASEILGFFTISEELLGYRHLFELGEKPLDIALSAAIETISYWRKQTGETFEVIHDKSSNMAEEKWMWDAIVSTDVPPTVVGFDRRRSMHFPLGVSSTTFEDSKAYLQLQYCDLVAGATMALAKEVIEGPSRSEYAEGLLHAGILDLVTNRIWPSTDVAPIEEHEHVQKYVDPNLFVGKIVSQVMKKR